MDLGFGRNEWNDGLRKEGRRPKVCTPAKKTSTPLPIPTPTSPLPPHPDPHSGKPHSGNPSSHVLSPLVLQASSSKHDHSVTHLNQPPATKASPGMALYDQFLITHWDWEGVSFSFSFSLPLFLLLSSFPSLLFPFLLALCFETRPCYTHQANPEFQVLLPWLPKMWLQAFTMTPG